MVESMRQKCGAQRKTGAPPSFEVGNDAAFNKLQSIIVQSPHSIRKDLA